MDKPISLSMKDYLIRTLAVKMMIPEKTIEAVINDQFNSANEAMKIHNSVEISGFGKFIFNYKKAQKKMEKMLSQKRLFESRLEDPSISEQKRSTEMVKLTNVINNINILKPKLYEHQTNLGGLEKQHSTTISSEGADQSNSQGQN
jgi:nucleoid DNA-binding protein